MFLYFCMHLNQWSPLPLKPNSQQRFFSQNWTLGMFLERFQRCFRWQRRFEITINFHVTIIHYPSQNYFHLKTIRWKKKKNGCTQPAFKQENGFVESGMMHMCNMNFPALLRQPSGNKRGGKKDQCSSFVICAPLCTRPPRGSSSITLSSDQMKRSRVVPGRAN